MVGHLRLEEEFLFPLVRQTFDAATLQEMGDEIAARHARRRARVASAVPSTSTTTTEPAGAVTAARLRVTPASPPPRARPLPATASTSLLSRSGSAVDD
jgi:hypothetical protein